MGYDKLARRVANQKAVARSLWKGFDQQLNMACTVKSACQAQGTTRWLLYAQCSWHAGGGSRLAWLSSSMSNLWKHNSILKFHKFGQEAGTELRKNPTWWTGGFQASKCPCWRPMARNCESICNTKHSRTLRPRQYFSLPRIGSKLVHQVGTEMTAYSPFASPPLGLFAQPNRLSSFPGAPRLVTQARDLRPFGRKARIPKNNGHEDSEGRLGSKIMTLCRLKT